MGVRCSAGHRRTVEQSSGEKPLFPSGGVGSARQPSWSPDGTQLVDISGDAGDTRVHIIGADGSGDRQLTANTPTPAPESRPVWVSPSR